jgi:hypothetical protein
MKRLVIIILCLLNTFVLSQNLKNDLSVGFNYSQNKSKTYTTVINTTTNYQKDWLVINNILNQNISFTNKITQNEVSNKFSIGLSKNKHSGFLNYQTNYSLTRDLNLDHLIGFGYGQRDSIFNLKINYSYAILYQNTTNKDITKIRNSFRLKLTQKTPNFNINIEYYFQPDFFNYNDYFIYGTSRFTYKVKRFGLSIISIVNYNSLSNIRLINTLNLGFTYSTGE